jgi:hypothetical protein
MNPGSAQALMAIAFALPCFLMAARLLRVWRDPMSIEAGGWVRLGVGVFVMEFILLQAGIFLAGLSVDARMRGAGWLQTLGLTAFLGLFAVAIALAFRSRMLFFSFLWMIGGRFLALAIGISAQTKALLQAHAMISMAIYFAMVVLSVMLPWPRLGITAAIANATRDPRASGTWVEEPHRAIGAAAVYFALLGVAEIALLTWVDPRRVFQQ